MNRDPTLNAEGGTRNRAARLRALNTPQQVQVELNDKRAPVAVQCEGETAKRVESLGEFWRVDDEWWRQTISRRYFEAVLDGGKRVVLFEDLLTGAWWLQKPA